jgi:hypothetical protein
MKFLLKFLSVILHLLYKGASLFWDKEILNDIQVIHLCSQYNNLELKRPPFVGMNSAPTVTNGSPYDVTATGATVNANITNTGGVNPTERGLVYLSGDTGDPTTANSKFSETGSFGTGAFTESMTGLTDGGQYRVRAYAINTEGTGYGTTVQLTLLKTVPIVTLSSPSSGATGVSLTPNLLFTGTEANNNEIEYKVEISTTSGFTGVGDGFNDDFNDDSIDTAVWTPDVVNATVTETGGKIVLDQEIGATDNYAQLSGATSGTTNYYDLSDNIWSVEVKVHSNVDTGTYIQARLDNDNRLYMEHSNGVLIASEEVANSFSERATITYTASTMNWWRFREDSGTLYWEYSDVGDIWTELWSESTPFSLSAMSPSLHTYQYTGNAGDIDTATFDNWTMSQPSIVKKSVIPDDTFTGTGDPHPWPSGNEITYTVQSGDALSADTTYYWRVAGYSPTGHTVYGEWSTLLGGTEIYYFDGSVSGATASGFTWSDETNADDGSTSTSATNNSFAGTKTTDYLEIKGTNSSLLGTQITEVTVQIHDGAFGFGTLDTLDVPSGGWTWDKVSKLEARAFGNAGTGDVSAEVYVEGDAGGTALGISEAFVSSSLSYIEIKVTHISQDWSFTTGSGDVSSGSFFQFF